MWLATWNSRLVPSIAFSYTGFGLIPVYEIGVKQDLSHAQPQRVFANVSFCDEEAFEVFPV